MLSDLSNKRSAWRKQQLSDNTPKITLPLPANRKKLVAGFGVIICQEKSFSIQHGVAKIAVLLAWLNIDFAVVKTSQHKLIA